MPNRILAPAALAGLAAVAFGAYAEHGMTADTRASIMVAMEQWRFHAIALLALGVVPEPVPRAFTVTAILWGSGLLLFSGGLIAAALTGLPELKQAAPMGGVAFMAGWAWLAMTTLRKRR